MKTYLSALLLLLCAAPLLAQPQLAKPNPSGKYRPHDLRAGFMFSSGVAADAVYANLYKMPTTLGGQLAYTYTGNLLRHSAVLQGGAGWLLSPYKAAGTVFGQSYEPQVDLPVDFQLRYNMAFRIWRDRHFDFRLGPGLHFAGSLWLANNSEVFRYGWLVHTGLGLKLFLGFMPTARHRLDFGAYLPVFNIGWRPPYTGYTTKEEALLETQGLLAPVFANPVFLFFHNMLDLTLQASYQYRLLPFLGLQASYQGRILYTTATRKRLELQSYVTIAVSFHF